MIGHLLHPDSAMGEPHSWKSLPTDRNAMLYDDQPEPSIKLNTEDQRILKLITKRFKPISVSDFIEISECMEHWTDSDRLACMTKMQNLGLLAIKTAESMGAMGMRESSMRGVNEDGP